MGRSTDAHHNVSEDVDEDVNEDVKEDVNEDVNEASCCRCADTDPSTLSHTNSHHEIFSSLVLISVINI